MDSFEVRLHLGSESATNAPLEHLVNGPGGAPHIAIMGKNGTGKTRTALALLRRVAGDIPYPVPFLVFDCEGRHRR